MITKSKGSTMLSGPLSTSIFQNKIVLQDLGTVLQFASGSCYKLRRLTIITKCCSPRYKMRSFHLLQNAATLITKCASYYKMPQPLLQNAQVITKCRRTVPKFYFKSILITNQIAPHFMKGHSVPASVIFTMISDKK